MDWAEAVAIEPGLGQLEHMARAAKGWHGWEALRTRLKTLVGFGARRPELGTTEAYERCYCFLLRQWEGGGRADRIHTEGLDEYGDPRHTASDHRLERRDYQGRDRARRRLDAANHGLACST